MDHLAEQQLHAAASSFGYLNQDNEYIREPDCVETCKELIYFLKREDETRQIRRKLGYLKVFENDLVNLILHYSEDVELFDIVIRLMQNLSTPAVLCYGKIPDDRNFRSYYIGLEKYLRSYKRSFTNEDLVYNVGLRMKALLESSKEDDEHEQEVLERILILFRNMLHVPADPSEEVRTDDDASLHDQLLYVISKTGLDAILKFLATSDAHSKWSLHVLEVIFHMMRDQRPELLAATGAEKSRKEFEIEGEELTELLNKQKQDRRAKMMMTGSRHSRFGGTYVVANLKSLNKEKDLIFHGTQNRAKHISFDQLKETRRKPKRLVAAVDRELPRRSTRAVRLFLKEFAVDMLDNSFNSLMHSVIDAISREKTQQHDESYYLWAIGFFLEFNRFYKFRTDVVSEVLNSEAFHYIYVQSGHYYEMMLQEKKAKSEAESWARRMHLALKAFGELLKTINTMGKSEDPEVKRAADILKRNVFYNSEFRELFLFMIKHFDITKMSKSYLRDLVEANHIFLKMLEEFANNKMVIVKKAKKKKKTAKKSSKSHGQGKSGVPRGSEDPEADLQAQLEEKWEELAPILSALLQRRIPLTEEAVPFDPISETPIEEQQSSAMCDVQTALRSGQAARALALLRASREVWPDADFFGFPAMPAEDEFNTLRSIHFQETLASDKPASTVNPAIPENEGADANLEVADDERTIPDAAREEIAEFESESEGERSEPDADRNEQIFDFRQFMELFARPEVVSAYSLILRDYKTNFTFMNHVAVKMLHRIAVDLGVPGLLFQASIFRIFQDIFNTFPGAAATESQKELFNFAKFIMRNFFKSVVTNKYIFVETLFWKDLATSYEVVEGYGSYVKSSGGAGHVTWSAEDNEELERLYRQYQASEMMEDDGGVVEFIMENFSRELSRPQNVVNQLVSLGIVADKTELRMTSRREFAGVWRPEHVRELEILWEQFKDSENPLDEVWNALTHDRPKNRVMQKLLQLGLATSQKDLLRKDFWPPELEQEVRDLYEIHKENADPCRGILDNISVPKSRRQIMNKLKDLNVIADVAELKRQKPKAVRQERVWTTEENDELIELFAKHKTIKLILQNCTFSASSSQVSKQLKHLGLRNKSGSKRSTVSNFLKANHMDNYEDSEEERLTKKPPKISNEQIFSCIRSVANSSYAEALDWLKSSLLKVANDRAEDEEDDDDSDPVSVPLVPYKDSAEEAVAAEDFKKLLTKLGMSPPRGTEVFWRVPASLSVQFLKEKAELLDRDSVPPAPEAEPDDAKSSDGEVNLASMRSQKRLPNPAAEDGSASEPENAPPTSEVPDLASDGESPRKKPQKYAALLKKRAEEKARRDSKKRLHDDGSDLSDSERPAAKRPRATEAKTKTFKSRLNRFDSSDSEPELPIGSTKPVDEEGESDANADTSISKKKKVLDSESESEHEKSTKKKAFISDGESEGEPEADSSSSHDDDDVVAGPEVSAPTKKSRTVVESDSDDDIVEPESNPFPFLESPLKSSAINNQNQVLNNSSDEN